MQLQLKGIESVKYNENGLKWLGFILNLLKSYDSFVW